MTSCGEFEVTIPFHGYETDKLLIIPGQETIKLQDYRILRTASQIAVLLQL